MRAILLHILLCGGTVFGLPLGPLMAQVSAQAKSDALSKQYDEAQVAYSQACLDLARFELKSGEAIQSSLSIGAIERRRIAVKVAEERLKVAMSQEAESDTSQVRLRFVEESARKARQDYLRALDSKTFSSSQIEHLRLKSEVAQRRFEVMQNPVHLMSIMDHMHWEIERLNDAVTALELKVQEVVR
jgi:hypothetical protein